MGATMVSYVPTTGVVSPRPAPKFNGKWSAGYCSRRRASRTARRWKNFSDFAVGFSRQPLPKGNRFAIVTNAGGPGIMATDATIQHGLELTTLRPETIESLTAKLPPTANFHNPAAMTGGGVFSLLTPRASSVASEISTVEDAGAGFRKITNGVKQRAPGTRPLGVEVNPATTLEAKGIHGVNPPAANRKGDGADVRIVLTSSRSP
jgi:hypothetical protein